MELTTKTMLDTILSLEEILTEKQLHTLQDMLYEYKQFQLELYDFPGEGNLFTQTQLELFDIFEIE